MWELKKIDSKYRQVRKPLVKVFVVSYSVDIGQLTTIKEEVFLGLNELKKKFPEVDKNIYYWINKKGFKQIGKYKVSYGEV